MVESLLSIALWTTMLEAMETLGSMVQRAMDAARPPIKGYQLAAMIGRQQSYVSKLVNDQLKDTPPPEVLRALHRELGLAEDTMLRALGYLSTTTPDASATPFPDDPVKREIYDWLAGMSAVDAGALKILIDYASQQRPPITTPIQTS